MYKNPFNNITIHIAQQHVPIPKLIKTHKELCSSIKTYFQNLIVVAQLAWSQSMKAS